MWKNRLVRQSISGLDMARAFEDRTEPRHVQSYPIRVWVSGSTRSVVPNPHYDFHGQKKTRRRFPNVPMENALVYNVHAGVCFAEFLLLQFHQVSTDFYDIVLRAFIDLWMLFLKIVENIARKRPVAGSNFVDDEILVRKVFEEVLRNKTLSNCLTIPRLELRISRPSNIYSTDMTWPWKAPLGYAIVAFLDPLGLLPHTPCIFSPLRSETLLNLLTSWSQFGSLMK